MTSRFITFALMFLVAGCHARRRIEPDKLQQGRAGNVCTVYLVGDIAHQDPCEEVRALMPPLGTCALRQVLGGDSDEVVRNRLYGAGLLEASNKSAWEWYRQLGNTPLGGTIVQSLETGKRSTCSSATSWKDVKRRGDRITVSELIPELAAGRRGGGGEVLYIQAGNGSGTGRRHIDGAASLFLRVDGPMTLIEAEQLTRSLVARLELTEVDTFVKIANHPWFFSDGGFPSRNPLIYSGPISDEDSTRGSIFCLADRNGISCAGPYGQRKTGLDGQ